MSIAKGHLEVAMTEKLAENGEVDAAHNQARGKGVPKVVKAEILQRGFIEGGPPRSLQVAILLAD